VYSVIYDEGLKLLQSTGVRVHCGFDEIQHIRSCIFAISVPSGSDYGEFSTVEDHIIDLSTIHNSSLLSAV
jgi:hypothetical protein